MSKLHLCCGDVYLDGYVNIDDRGTIGVPKETTTLENYYENRSLGCGGEVIVDAIIDLNKSFYRGFEEKVEEIVMINAITHFSYDRAQKLCEEIWLCLRHGGRFLFDFPDIKKICHLYNGNEMMRYIFGHKSKEYGMYGWGYDAYNVKLMLGSEWKRIKFKEIVKHDFPAIGVEAVKI